MILYQSISFVVTTPYTGPTAVNYKTIQHHQYSSKQDIQFFRATTSNTQRNLRIFSFFVLPTELYPQIATLLTLQIQSIRH